MQQNQPYLAIKNALRACKKAFLFCLLFSFFISIFTLASSIYSMQVLDRVLSSNSIETLIFLTIIIAIFLIFLGILTFVRSAILMHIANWLDESLSPILFGNELDAKSIEYKKANKTIHYQQLQDLKIVKNFISGPHIATLFDTPFAIIYLLIIFFIHPINGFITVVGGLIMLKIAYINEKSTKELIDKTNSLQIESMRDFEIIASNSEVINAMAMKSNVYENWEKIHSELRKESTKLSAISNKISATSKSVRIIIQTVTMASSAILVIFNKMSSGSIIATSILAGKALTPFDSAISLWKTLKTAKASFVRLNESLKNNVGGINKIELPIPKGDILVEKLSYRNINSEHLVIKGISFKINAGEAIAIIGPTGGGKTTLARLLVGVLKPATGSIRIDGANIFDQNSEKIGKYIGYLPQNIELFKGSVKENIARMNKNADDTAIIKAAKFCGIHEIILSLPQGYETEILKDASNLSAGQKQRIALARAFFGDVKLVILDEPNSNLDSDGETALNQAIIKAKENNITTIIITHRTSVANVCDKIMILKDGEIKAFDNSESIIKKLT